MLATPVKEISAPRRGKGKADCERRQLLSEIRNAHLSADVDEVLALVRLSFPDRPAVFNALSIGCVDTLRTVLSRGADPNETFFDGLSPLAYCILSTANPMTLDYRTFGVSALRNFTVEEAAEFISVLLSSGATPTPEDMRHACLNRTATIGKLLLDSGFSLLAAKKGCCRQPLILLAAQNCPELVYPMLECGAEMPDILPFCTSPAVFMEAQWKQVRTLYMLHGRQCLPVPRELLVQIAACLAEPVRPRNALEERDDVAIAWRLPPPRFDDLLSAMPFC
jgi:hypothetical protein